MAPIGSRNVAFPRELSVNGLCSFKSISIHDTCIYVLCVGDGPSMDVKVNSKNLSDMFHRFGLIHSTMRYSITCRTINARKHELVWLLFCWFLSRSIYFNFILFYSIFLI